MNRYLFLLIVLSILSILCLIYFICYFRLNNYKEKMDKAEQIIDENLTNKIDIIIKMNETITKVTGRKDYLKEYLSIKKSTINNYEKDNKLYDAEKLINNLVSDYKDFTKDKEFKKLLSRLRETDEIITSAKKMFNNNAMECNKLIKTFPNNIVSKLSKFKIRSYYTNKKAEDFETF